MWASGSEANYLNFWWVWLMINFLLAVVFSVWFSIGGIHDLRAFFERLSKTTRDDADDGTVTPSGAGGDALILNSDGKLGAAEDSAAAEAGGPSPEDDAYEPPSLGASVTAL